MFEVFFSGLKVARLELTIAKLVANVDEEDWLVEDDFSLDLSLDTFELLYCFDLAVTVHQTFS